MGAGARRLAPAVAAAVALAACGGGERGSAAPQAGAPTLRVSSPAFAPGATLPRAFTCDGDGAVPPLRFGGAPPRTAELALVVEDPDAPGGTFVHWTRFGMDPSARAPAGGSTGDNSDGESDWYAPCPPEGDEPHRYVFRLYALRSPSRLEQGAKPRAVRAAIRARALARGELVARYGRG